MKRSNPEFQQHVAIVQWLKLCAPDIVFFHVPNGGGRGVRTAANLKAMGLRPGVPDLCLIDDNGVFFAEIKSGKGKPSKAQTEFADAVALLGIPIHIVRNIDDICDVIKQRGHVVRVPA